jgi:hypothetical protein
MPEPAQFLMVEGDQLIYCQGRLAWYFQAGNGLYWVTRPEFFASLPSVDQLLMLRIQDRHRLWQWLDDRNRQTHAAPCWGDSDPHWGPDGFRYRMEAKPAPVEPPRKHYNPQYDPVNLELHAAAREQQDKERQKRADALNKKRMDQEIGVDVDRRRRAVLEEKPYENRNWRYDFGAMVAAFLDDHDFIQAMFDLYSQQRSRLL